MVIWDEPKADVFHRMEVNGIAQAEAQQMYHKARAARIAIIRTAAARTAAGGFGLLFIGVSVIIGSLNGLGGITRTPLIACMMATAFGTWRLFKGLFGFILAHSKEGSLADDED